MSLLKIAQDAAKHRLAAEHRVSVLLGLAVSPVAIAAVGFTVFSIDQINAPANLVPGAGSVMLLITGVALVAASFRDRWRF